MPVSAIGFFGKLPGAGDFVQRRLPAGFVDAWDSHFESAVAASRQALGGSWHAAYHASPAWRFLLAPGVCGDAAWAGVMGPGVDRVGRCFPMVVAAPVAVDSLSAAQALLDDAAWFDAIEQVCGLARADSGIGVDAFDARVEALGAPLGASSLPAPEGLVGIDWDASGHWRLPLPMRADTSFLGELWRRLVAAPGSWCLWWNTATARVLATSGLPQPEAYAGFLLDADTGGGAWRSPNGLVADSSRRHEAPDMPVAMPAAPASAMPAAWLPDDPELFSDLASSPQPPPGVEADVEPAPAAEPHASAAVVLHRPDAGATLVVASSAPAHPRQRAVAAVAGIGRDLSAGDWMGGMRVLRSRVMALNPGLQQAAEDLVDPVPEDCSMVAVRVTGDRAELLRVGSAAAWRWRQGNLQPVFAEGVESSGGDDDIDDLLFNRGRPASPGLGAAAQPACDEVVCAVGAGDRLLLLATPALVQLSPEIFVRSLAMPSSGAACQHIATAAGLGTPPGRWPIAIIEVEA